jgi:hypothetical protein
LRLRLHNTACMPFLGYGTIGIQDHGVKYLLCNIIGVQLIRNYINITGILIL